MANEKIVGKGNRERQVFLSDQACIEALRRYISEHHGEAKGLSERLLLNSRGRPATAASLRRRITMLGQRAGLARRVTPHMLRHTAATSLLVDRIRHLNPGRDSPEAVGMRTGISIALEPAGRRRLEALARDRNAPHEAAIDRPVADTNNDPKPFSWTANPNKIIAAVRRGHQVLDLFH